MPFVQHYDRTGARAFLDPFCHSHWVAPHSVEPAHRPPDQAQPARRERGMRKHVSHPGGRAEKIRWPLRRGPQGFRAERDLAAYSSGSGAPESAARVRVGVVGEGVAPGQDFGDEMRILLGVRADDEERRARIKLLQEVEHRDGVSGRRTIVNRDPDLAFVGVKAGEDRAPPLTVRHERGVEQQQVGDEKREKRENHVRAAKGENQREQRRQKCTSEERGAGGIDITRRRFHCEKAGQARVRPRGLRPQPRARFHPRNCTTSPRATTQSRNR